MEISGISRLVRPEIPFPVRPELAPARTHQHDGAIGNAAVQLFPGSDICHGHSIVRILSGTGSDVNDCRGPIK